MQHFKILDGTEPVEEPVSKWDYKVGARVLFVKQEDDQPMRLNVRFA